MATRRIGPVEIAYEIDEPPAGVTPKGTLVWLHGGFVTRTSWEPQRAHFSKRPWRSIYIDLVGHGESSKIPARYDIELFAEDVLGLLRELGIDQVVCIGHSLGGMVAQSVARREPHRVIGLVLADTTYSTGSTVTERFERAFAKSYIGLISVEKLARASAKQLGKFRRDVGRYVYEEMMRYASDKQGVERLLHAVFEFDSRPWLNQITCPVLLLIAQENKPTMRQRGGFERMIPSLRSEVVPRSGHMLNWDNPEGFNEAIERFLTREVG